VTLQLEPSFDSVSGLAGLGLFQLISLDLRKAQKEFLRKAAAKTKEAADLLLIVPLPHAQEQSATKSIIDNLELAERVFTTVYLYAVNECRRDAKDNLEYVNRKAYTKSICRGYH
jgi:hypothetical protein